ncbi:S-adenosyl-L-methionine-dependent methyltransferase [Mycena sanguinolenta]|nr:S-adenosyl-L-methionine-dependent methyltransferase [Mycena sanguinolenta]
MASPNFYVLVPELPPRLSPQKRKARSPSPADSACSSRVASPNLSPTKRIRRDKDVDAATSRMSTVDLASNAHERLESPIPDFAGPTLYSGEGDDAQSSSSDDESDSGVVFQFEEEEYELEASCPALLGESVGDGLPIRRLRDFTLFRSHNLRLINGLELLHPALSTGMYSASGLVESVKEEDDDTSQDSEDEDDSESQSSSVLLKLTIIELDTHDFSDGEFNENIYIKTDYAWYLLDKPSTLYESFWQPLWLRHQLAHRVLTSSLNEPRMTMDQFIDRLNSEEREVLTEVAFKSDDVVAYITGAIEQVLADDAPIARVPLIRSFNDRPALPPPEHEHRAVPKVSKGVKQDTIPLVTPIIKRVLDKHLTSPISLVGAEYEKANQAVANEIRDVIEHHHDPKSIHWRKCQGKYTGVEVDGVVYEIGDVVAVAPGDDTDADRAKSEAVASSHCINKFANNVWFIRIMYFYDHPTDTEHHKPRKMLHGQWFVHGSRTILQETPHSQELFLLNECDGIPVASIFQKCTVRFLEVGEAEEPDQSDAEARSFFYRYLYNNEEHSFTDIPSPPPDTQCPNCRRKDELKLYNRPRIVDDSLVLHGRTYHVGDFVYIKPDSEKKGLVLFVARVIKINCGKSDIVISPEVTLRPRQLRVRHYRRDENDPRQVYRTSSTNCVDPEDLDGLFFVQQFDQDQAVERDAWIDANPDHFHIDGEEEFKCCEECLQKHLVEVEEIESLPLRFGGPLPVLEVFSGAGGLSQGLGQSKFFQTQWAVERSVPAAKTFSLNHPETHVLCADINDLLQYSAEIRYGDGKPSPLQSSDEDSTPIPDDWIPKMGQPGLVCGGPPCQSFSGANSHKKENDPRSNLPFTMLSVAEVYEPNFFLLENVTGLLQHSVTNKAGDGRLVEKAMLKLIIRGLIALDYQARFKVLQAGQHGAPQGRERLIFFGAKRGCKLPEFPIPTHAFSRPPRQYQLFIQNDFIPPARRGRGPNDDHIFAPHASVTVNDAIGDLARFDWINPHKLRAKTSADVAKVNNRVAQGILQMDPSTSPVGFANPVAYATPPMTRYQRAMRGNLAKAMVEYHYTNKASPFVAEASVNVPLKPYSNHTSLPDEFFANSKLKKKIPPVCFGRLDGKEYFKTAVTAVAPRSRGSYVLHPNQYRAISVLEAKRAQGFPDDYVLWSGAKQWTHRIADYYRHIGNAVPVPLAAALGRSLEAAFVETWKRMPKEGSPEL